MSLPGMRIDTYEFVEVSPGTYDYDYGRGWDDGVEGRDMIDDPNEAYYDGYSDATDALDASRRIQLERDPRARQRLFAIARQRELRYQYDKAA